MIREKDYKCKYIQICMYINILVTCGVINFNDNFVFLACLVSVMAFVGL